MLSSRMRVAVPFAVTGLIAVGAVAPTLRASASPHLPALTARQLVAKAAEARVSQLSGTFEWRANLGLPSLGGLTSGAGQGTPSSSGFDVTALVSGTHTFNLWIDGAESRIAAPGSLSETDVVRRGDQAWLYDSSTQHVTHYIFRAGAPAPAEPSLSAVNVTTLADTLVSRAREAGTDVSVGRPVDVAGRPAYVLRLGPDRALAANAASTVSAVTVAVDAKTGLPLRVTVYAAGQASPALQVGYSSIRLAAPSASIFAVPHGRTTATKVVGRPVDHRAGPRPATPAPPAADPSPAPAIGRDWGAIVNLPSGDVATGAAAGELDSVTSVVSGSWGSGRLLASTLANALFLPDGRVLAGFVTPAALEAAAGRLAP